MADVNPNPGSRYTESRHTQRRSQRCTDRGQLILVTGLLIAVAMVALVLLLNTAIYTENLASRGTDQSGREAIEYRATVVEGVGGLIEAENGRAHEDTDSLGENVTDGVDVIDNFTSRSYAGGGTVVWIDQASLVMHNGTLIRQTAERSFENRSGTAEWLLATDVEGTRSFSMTVERDENLSRTNESMVVQDGAFNVTLDAESGSTWQLYVYSNETSPEDDITVAVRSGGGSTREVWSSEGDQARIDVTDGTINGNEISELDWRNEISTPYEISYGGGGQASGTYTLTVNSTSVIDANYADEPSSPHYFPAIYSVTVDVSYETPTLAYRSEVRVAPGEPE